MQMINARTNSVLTFDLSLLSDGSRVVQMDDSFFTGYRRTIVRPQEILLSIHIPYSKKVGMASP